MENDEVKIKIRLDDTTPFQLEGLWAEKVGPDLYRLLNTPFTAYGYAWGDVVRCQEEEDGLYVVEVVNHSGSSTVRIVFAPTTGEEAREEIVNYLSYLGCSFESTGEQFPVGDLYAFDVPAEPELKISMRELAIYLNELEQREVLNWETGKWLSEVDPNAP